MKKSEPYNWLEIKIGVNNIEITGSYSVDQSGWMTVRMNGGGSKQTRGGPSPEGVARLILRELFDEASGSKL